MVEQLLFFVLANFPLSFFVLGILVSAISLARKPKPLAGPEIAEALFKWFVFFSMGVSYLYNAVTHVIWHKMAAQFIGWPDSPFQLEVGFASFGFGVIGLLATWRSFDLRLAAVVGPACFLWGAAAGHVYSMVTQHNFAPGNAGVMLWADILLPIVGFVLLWLQHKYEREGRSVAPR